MWILPEKVKTFIFTSMYSAFRKYSDPFTFCYIVAFNHCHIQFFLFNTFAKFSKTLFLLCHSGVLSVH